MSNIVTISSQRELKSEIWTPCGYITICRFSQHSILRGILMQGDQRCLVSWSTQESMSCGPKGILRSCRKLASEHLSFVIQLSFKTPHLPSGSCTRKTLVTQPIKDWVWKRSCMTGYCVEPMEMLVISSLESWAGLSMVWVAGLLRVAEVPRGELVVPSSVGKEELLVVGPDGGAKRSMRGLSALHSKGWYLSQNHFLVLSPHCQWVIVASKPIELSERKANPITIRKNTNVALLREKGITSVLMWPMWSDTTIWKPWPVMHRKGTKPLLGWEQNVRKLLANTVSLICLGGFFSQVCSTMAWTSCHLILPPWVQPLMRQRSVMSGIHFIEWPSTGLVAFAAEK